MLDRPAFKEGTLTRLTLLRDRFRGDIFVLVVFWFANAPSIDKHYRKDIAHYYFSQVLRPCRHLLIS